MTHSEDALKEMNERLTAANKYLRTVETLQAKSGDRFSSELFQEVLQAKEAWKLEMDRYRRLESTLAKRG